MSRCVFDEQFTQTAINNSLAQFFSFGFGSQTSNLDATMARTCKKKNLNSANLHFKKELSLNENKNTSGIPHIQDKNFKKFLLMPSVACLRLI